jgi:Spy/CpxP family protein refolding chaperone
MNKLTKKQLLTGALILLFAVNLAALGTIIYQNYQEQEQQQVTATTVRDRNLADPSERPARYSRRSMEPGAEPGTGRGFEHYIQRRLNLDEAQSQQYKALMRETRRNQRAIIHQMDRKRDSLMQAIASENSDTTRMNRLAGEIGNLHARLKHNTIDHFQKLRSICTPEQMPALNEMIRRMGDRQIPQQQRERPHRGRGRHR